MGRPKELTEEQRADLLARGFRPVEVWVPDWESPDFGERIRREMDAIVEADARDPGIDEWVRQVRGDLWDDVAE